MSCYPINRPFSKHVDLEVYITNGFNNPKDTVTRSQTHSLTHIYVLSCQYNSAVHSVQRVVLSEWVSERVTVSLYLVFLLSLSPLQISKAKDLFYTKCCKYTVEQNMSEILKAETPGYQFSPYTAITCSVINGKWSLNYKLVVVGCKYTIQQQIDKKCILPSLFTPKNTPKPNNGIWSLETI